MFQDFLLFSVQLTISISPRQFHLGTRLRLTHFTHILRNSSANSVNQILFGRDSSDCTRGIQSMDRIISRFVYIFTSLAVLFNQTAAVKGKFHICSSHILISSSWDIKTFTDPTFTFIRECQVFVVHWNS